MESVNRERHRKNKNILRVIKNESDRLTDGRIDKQTARQTERQTVREKEPEAW